MPEDPQISPAVENATVTQAGSFEDLLDDGDFSEDLLDDGDLAEDLLDAGDVIEDDDDTVLDFPLPELEHDDFEDLDDDDDDDIVAGGEPIAVSGDDNATAPRVPKLETAARERAAAEVTREGRRVKRKVAAATTGAGATGFIPLLLQMLGVYDLDPAIAATLSTVASLIGAFAAGWVTPERTPPLPVASAHSLLELGGEA